MRPRLAGTIANRAAPVMKMRFMSVPFVVCLEHFSSPVGMSRYQTLAVVPARTPKATHEDKGWLVHVRPAPGRRAHRSAERRVCTSSWPIVRHQIDDSPRLPSLTMLRSGR